MANEVTFVRADSPPPRPPAVFLRLAAGSDEQPLELTSYTHDWVIEGRNDVREPATPVPWPEPREIEPPASAHLVFDAESQPTYVEVRAYDDLDPQTGVPLGEADETWSCSRFDAPRCEFELDASGAVTVAGPPEGLLAHANIVVFASWLLPTAERGFDGAQSEVSASWLGSLGGR